MALAFYPGDAFGPTYKGGLFVAFHGSWNRAPLPQEGYRVVFVPSPNGKPTGKYSDLRHRTQAADRAPGERRGGGPGRVAVHLGRSEREDLEGDRKR